MMPTTRNSRLASRKKKKKVLSSRNPSAVARTARVKGLSWACCPCGWSSPVPLPCALRALPISLPGQVIDRHGSTWHALLLARRRRQCPCPVGAAPPIVCCCAAPPHSPIALAPQAACYKDYSFSFLPNHRTSESL
eukprot:gene12888-biopygen3800